MMKIRGKEIAMIFQEPMTSLNPVFTIGEQIAETVRLHEGLGRRDAMDKAVEMLRIVRIPLPESPGQGVPASPVRRHAATGDACDRAPCNPEASNRR